MSDNPIDVPPGSFPLYTNDPASNPLVNNADPVRSKEKQVPQMVALITIPQGGGSGLNSDMVDGIHAVTAAIAGPSVLVATGIDNRLPFPTIQSPMQRFLWQQFNGF